MSPQLQQVLTEIDRLSPIEQIKVIEYINTKQLSSVLETITNLRPAKAAHSLSQQSAFKTPQEIDFEILEEKSAY